MRRAGRLSLAMACVVTLAACSGVPTSGDVVKVSPASRARVERGVQVHPVAPQPGASPDVVLAGFLDAMASLEPGFEVARQYLTPQAASRWDPQAGVTVFDGDTRSSLPGSTAAGLQARVVGTLDEGGHYTPARGRMLRQSFTMEQVDGQWRINNPPAGLLVSQYTLLHRFTPTTVWFFARGSQTLVPERVWLARNPASPADVVQALLRGPSGWLAPTVASALPVGTKLGMPAVAVDDGVAEVPLERAVANLPEPERSRALTQIAWTLQPFAEIRRIRVVVDGQPWGSEVNLDQLPGGSGLPAASQEDPLAVIGQAVGRLDMDGVFTPLSGVLGTGAGIGRPGRIAAASQPEPGVVAVVNREGNRLVTAVPGQAKARTRLSAPGLGRPVMTATGELWVATGGDGARAIHRATRDGAAASVHIPELAGGTVRNFAVSPDQTRLALVLERQGRTELGLMRIHEQTIDGYRRLPLQVSQLELAQVVDVGWTGQEELMVLAAQHVGARASGYLVSIDGAQVDPVGPVGDSELVELMTRPQAQTAVALLRTAEGDVLRYDSPWRWRGLPRRVAALTMGS
ncbi:MULTISPECIES: LpqB family beta-propeller domain-containing protein [unclassified Luteococcus]|uniref:LpqB family beta-propeller domain-containing protein n=1 Tax=unclassified Luteococcus TaxID=2639923 RepID=UPI00313D0E12